MVTCTSRFSAPSLEAVEQLAQPLGIGRTGRRFGVVFGEVQGIRQEERVEPRRGAGPRIAGIEADQPLLGVGDSQGAQQPAVLHRRRDDALADRGDGFGRGPDAGPSRPQETPHPDMADRRRSLPLRIAAASDAQNSGVSSRSGLRSAVQAAAASITADRGRRCSRPPGRPRASLPSAATTATADRSWRDRRPAAPSFPRHGGSRNR